jgi:hypothetical protein
VGDIVAFHRYRCVLCGRPVDATRLTRFSERDRLDGWGCACQRRKLTLVADFLPVQSTLATRPAVEE